VRRCGRLGISCAIMMRRARHSPATAPQSDAVAAAVGACPVGGAAAAPEDEECPYDERLAAAEDALRARRYERLLEVCPALPEMSGLSQRPETVSAGEHVPHRTVHMAGRGLRCCCCCCCRRRLR
jgi:hypothetical protein